jgi:hypothetical protein
LPILALAGAAALKTISSTRKPPTPCLRTSSSASRAVWILYSYIREREICFGSWSSGVVSVSWRTDSLSVRITTRRRARAICQELELEGAIQHARFRRKVKGSLTSHDCRASQCNWRIETRVIFWPQVNIISLASQRDIMVSIMYKVCQPFQKKKKKHKQTIPGV